MRYFLLLIVSFFSLTISAQNELLAGEYFKKGEFEKARIGYEKLYKKSPKNRTILYQLIKTEQQLELYNDAELLIIEALNKTNYEPLLVELGYNYQLKKDTINAKINYLKAMSTIDINPNNAYGIGRAFEQHSLLDYAIKSYKKAMELKPSLDFNSQLARIYGEQGDVEKMFNSYIGLSERNETYLNSVKRAFSEFISEDSNNENNILLRKILLKKIQKEPNVQWNKMLSWLFIQQKDYHKAFIQEKAIYKRELENLDRINELAFIAINDDKKDIAKSIFEYLVNNTQDIDAKLKAHHHLLKLETDLADKKDYKTIQKHYLELFDSYGKFSKTLDLQIAYAHFLAFNLENYTEATQILKTALDLKLTVFQKARVKLELGDVLVLQEKYNEALIYYTQIQRRLKNSTLSQEARFKVAKTSYYKGDFKWAESQLKILKSSTSQLTANDALDLKLLIADNKEGDSLQTALKLYAKADLLDFQNKKDEAIKTLNTILNDHKTETIVAQALLKQALLFTEKKEFTKAADNYLKLITDYKESILVDDALFFLATIYEQELVKPEAAKKLYEQIIFEHKDSIYFVDARKRFRALRGDSLN
ncbi:tetratricopeptide repeat protein [Lacinutrix salivirga]